MKTDELLPNIFNTKMVARLRSRRRHNRNSCKIGVMHMNTNFLTRRKFSELEKALKKARQIMKILNRSRVKTRSSIEIPGLNLYLELTN